MIKKILVLEDDQDILYVVQEVLEYERFLVKGISNCQEVLKLGEEFVPDLFLLDFRLQDGNGGEVCRDLKSHPLFAATPVIIFSAYAQKNIDFSAYGCDGVIEKPFDLDQLIEMVNLLLTKTSV
ncbi:response regulator [Pedobacter sp. ASV28]|uniref:response regulator n=1 Tax=Pedobacter sp. ASV28 TaxID=2795123 RepID=UPI0018ECF3D3|nr:response regulator [Pedobacter sp. ASV28]